MKHNIKYGVVAALTMAAFVAPVVAPLSTYAAETGVTTKTELDLASGVTYTTKFNKSAVKANANYSNDIVDTILAMIYIKDGSNNTWYQASKYDNMKLGVYNTTSTSWVAATSTNLKGSKDGTSYKVAVFDGMVADANMVDNNVDADSNPAPTELTITVKKISVSGSIAVTASAPKHLTYGSINRSEWTFKIGSVVVDGSAATYVDADGADQAISGLDSADAGTYTVKLNLSQGDYELGLATDTSAKPFTGKVTITPATLSADDVTVTSVPYTGSEIKNNVAVTGLTEDEHYTLSYSNNVKVGTATVKITGKGNYTGTITKNFAITPATISAIGDTTAMYTGSVITPAIVDNGGYKLTSGYTVSFDADQDHKNVGNSTFTFKGDNSNVYTATDGLTGAFEILQLNINGNDAAVFTNASKAKEYSLENGIAVVISTKAFDATPTVSAVYAYGNLVSANLYTAKVAKTGAAGTANNKTITFTGAAAEVATGNVAATATVTYTATNEKSISDATISGIARAYTYNGESKEPAVSVALSGEKLEEDVDYVVSYKNNVKVGTATVTITGIGDYTGKVTKSFYIDPAKSSIKKVAVAAKKMTVTVKKGTAASGVQIAYRVKGTTKWSYVKTTGTSKTISSLKKGKKYQVVVRSYTTKSGKITNYSGWSATKTSAKIK